MQQQRQQQQQSDEQKLAEEYRAAQRAAVESVYVGRATAEAVARQGEQLQNADRLADDTQFKLDKAQRVLKGMTWSGMVSNWFTPNVKAPSSLTETSSSDIQRSMESYDNMPSECQPTAQAIKNYHANVSVLLECETEEQKETLKLICDQMHEQAATQLKQLKSPSTTSNTSKSNNNINTKLKAYILQLESDLDQLRKKQLASQAQLRGLVDALAQADNDTGENDSDKQKEELFGRKPTSGMTNSTQQQQQQSSPPAAKSSVEQRQDKHLAVISASLGELGHIAGNLKEGLHQQTQLIDTLDNKTENLNESSKRVARRTDRLIQTKKWTPAKAVFKGNYSLRHVDTGKYLAVLQNEVFLVNRRHPQTCQFAVHQRPNTRLAGLRNHSNRSWLGQSFLTGSLQCAAKTLGRREEFELDQVDLDNVNDDDTSTTTRLLCASAGWGHGGYLQVHPNTFAVTIGGSSVADSQSAARFCLIPHHPETNSENAHRSNATSS